MAFHHETRRARPKHPDVAATARAGLALPAPGTHYRQFFERAPAGVFVQCEGRFAYLNPKAVAMFGASLESDLLGRPVLGFLHPDDREAIRERTRRMDHERALGPTLAARWQRLDGTTFHGESAAVPCMHQGQPGALVMLQDITTRKVAEEQRAAALEALKSRDDEFHAIVDNLAECALAMRDAVPAPSVAQARGRGRLVLVVEDDVTSRKVIASLLGFLGCAAEHAGNGEEALRRWHEGGHALVLTDLHMPWMDGYSLVKAIRREEAGRSRVPVVALTGGALHDETDRALAAGVDGCLTKPVQLRQLRAVLDRWLPARAEAGAGRLPLPDGRLDPASVPDVDRSVLEGVTGGDPAQARELLGAYLDSARGLAQGLRSSLAAGNPNAVAFFAQRLKSSSRAVGAAELGDVCDRMECAGRAGDMLAVLQHLRGFETSLEAVEADIARTLARG